MPYFSKEDFPKHLKCYTKVCDWCETTFYSSKPKAKYCRNTCRAYAYQMRHPERNEKQPTKKELQTAFTDYQQQSFYFNNKKQFNQVRKRLRLLKSQLQLMNPAWLEMEEDELLTALILQLDFSEEDITAINNYLKK